MSAHNFLVIDDNAESRFLLVKTLLRKFPSAIVQECQQLESALELAAQNTLTAVVVHRVTEAGGLAIVPKLREANPTVPIVMVSGIDRRSPALAAGADEFLLYDEWLRIGTVVASLIAGPDTGSSSTRSPIDRESALE
ncbi:MAG TPA: response regulator [Opitutaceae bacterium]|nr:response regulator [Opitutaceae bacterium]